MTRGIVMRDERVKNLERGLVGGMLWSQNSWREIFEVASYIVEAFANNL
jgi:hypothetical protein